MNKRFAIFGSGWSNECLMVMNEVFVNFANANNIDLFYFINYSVANIEGNEAKKEFNVFKLPDLSLFDGAVILGNTLHLDEEFDILRSSIKSANIPAVCIGYKLDDISSIECDNYNGMYELIEHLVKEHDVSDVVYVGGPSDNQESRLREKALRDVFVKYNRNVLDENILCADWNYFDAQSEIIKWYKDNNETLPQAVVCANDIMAMGSYVGLSKIKAKGLDNLIITGFDDLISGYVFSPSITSVDPGWKEMASEGMKYLLDCINNKISTDEIVNKIIKSHCSIKESCGCNKNRNCTLVDGGEIFLGYERIIGGSYLNGYLCEISNEFSEIKTKEDIKKIFEHIKVNNYSIEGDELCICVRSDFFDTIYSREKLVDSDYIEYTEVFGGYSADKILDNEVFLTRELMPFYNENTEGSNQYLFVSLTSKNEYYGYAVMKNHLSILYDMSMYLWAVSMGQNLEKLRQNFLMEEMNKTLSNLSVTDALTGVYNRMGCEKIAFPLLEKCYNEGEKSVIIFIDINRMKVINDCFGHEHGDMAIILTAEAIKTAVPNDWVIVRYGGDEFIVVGPCTGNHQVTDITENIHNNLVELAKKKKLPYSLKVEVGEEYIEVDEKLDLYNSLRIADAKMYARKKGL